MGLQTVNNVRTYVSPKIMSHHSLVNMDYNKYFYTPRTLFTLGILTMFILALAFDWCEKLKNHFKPIFHDPRYPDEFEDFRFPILFGCLTIVSFASVMFPDSFIKRPHPVFWRILLGIMLCYSTFMTMVLLLPVDRARWVFKLFHPSFGVLLPERNYADDCRLYTAETPEKLYIANLYDNIYDVHFVAHLAGWWFKMMIIRDTKIAWIVSITFELVEISYRHMLPNFWECWWDQMFLDLFGCNMAGIIMGAWTIKWMGISRINWLYKKPTANKASGCEEGGPIGKAIHRLRPNVLTTYDWQMFSSLKRYLQILFYIWFVLSVDSLNFFMKFVLWIPAESDILKFRVAIWAFSAIVTSKEYFEYVDDPNCKRVGPFFWLSTYTIFVEYMIWHKFKRGFIENLPFPIEVKMIHFFYGSLVITGGV